MHIFVLYSSLWAIHTLLFWLLFANFLKPLRLTCSMMLEVQTFQKDDNVHLNQSSRPQTVRWIRFQICFSPVIVHIPSQCLAFIFLSPPGIKSGTKPFVKAKRQPWASCYLPTLCLKELAMLLFCWERIASQTNRTRSFGCQRLLAVTGSVTFLTQLLQNANHYFPLWCEGHLRQTREYSASLFGKACLVALLRAPFK